MTKEQWQQKRANGKNAYIAKYGVFYWGVPTGLIWGGVMSLLNPSPSILSWLLIGVICFALGGIFFGASQWRRNEKRYS